jgi:hypothetical protein
MHVEFNIDELALTGFEYGDRHLIAESAQRELSRIAAEQGMPSLAAQNGDYSRLDGGTFETTLKSKPASIGTLAG